MIERLYEELSSMAYLPVEEVQVWFFDEHGTILGWWVAGVGDERGASFSLRELFMLAWIFDASGIVIAHNHPNGNPNPSLTDIDFTEYVREVAESCDVALIDHVVVGHDSLFSIIEDRAYNPDPVSQHQAVNWA